MSRVHRWPALVAVFCALVLVSLCLSACAGPDSEPPASTDPPTTSEAEDAGWTLACTPFPPGDEIPDCARRDADGRITVRPEVAQLEDPADGGDYDDDTAPFEGALPAVLIDGEPYYVLGSGVAARTLWYDNGPDLFVSGRARTIRDGKIGFVDAGLAEAIPPAWDFAFPFAGSFARVCSGCTSESDGEHGIVSGGTWGYIDLQGEIVVPVVHEQDDLPPPPAEPGT